MEILTQKLNNLIKERTELDINLNSYLPKSILQEAIQGRLVPQDPNDEPVSVLLKRIRAEKSKLVKAKKIKKDKAESVIFRGDDNCYYEQIGSSVEQIDIDLPPTWGAVRLGSICQLLDGEKKNGKGVCLDAKYLRGKSYGIILDKGRFVKHGDTIILVDGENSGEVFTAPQDGYIGSTFKQLWVSNELYLPYVLFFLLFHKTTLRNSKKGAAIPHLNRDLFNNLIIGIPPIEEQKRISKRIITLFEHLK